MKLQSVSDDPACHEVSRAKLCMCVAISVTASMFVSFVADAVDCFPSADAVKQQHSKAWPRWTLSAPGFKGTKCWYPSTQAAAHDHGKPPAQVVISEPREPEPEGTRLATGSELAYTSEARVDAVQLFDTWAGVLGPEETSNLDSSFEDRFLAVCPIADHLAPGCMSEPRN
jgi:hypothetical protein